MCQWFNMYSSKILKETVFYCTLSKSQKCILPLLHRKENPHFYWNIPTTGLPDLYHKTILPSTYSSHSKAYIFGFSFSFGGTEHLQVLLHIENTVLISQNSCHRLPSFDHFQNHIHFSGSGNLLHFHTWTFRDKIHQEYPLKNNRHLQSV